MLLKKTEQVTLSSKDAQVGVELTATLTDLEGGSLPLAKSPIRCGRGIGSIRLQDCYWLMLPTMPLMVRPHLPIHRVLMMRLPCGEVSESDGELHYQFGGTAKTGDEDASPSPTSRANQAPKFKDGASTFRSIAENAAADDVPTNRREHRGQRREPGRCHGR